MAVLPRNSLKYVAFVPDNDPRFTNAATRILLFVSDGVIETENPVTSVKLVLAVVNVSVLAVVTTCKIRNAPRKLFMFVAVRT
jgi:hypothetical protein